MKFDFLKPTIIFSFIGFFIPGFTAIGVVGLQVLLTKVGFECPMIWKTIWILSISTSVLLPVLFYKHIKNLKINKLQSLDIRLLLFNFLEYVSIQFGLHPLFTNAHISCYVSDGQNGLELAFTGWLALPILILLSFIFNKTIKLTYK